MGPEDVLGGDGYGMWQYGSGSSVTDKNLQYLQNLAADPQATAALGFFCIHGYASDGVSAANATPTQWDWWANGWTSSPGAGLLGERQGVHLLRQKSWMTETSGEDPAWLSPATGFPSGGAWSIGLRIHQALTTGQQSGWAYWQMTDGNAVGSQTLTDSKQLADSPKYVAVKHFFRCIRPNAIRVNATVSGSTNLSASAYLHETNQSLTIVLINSSASAVPATINVPAIPPGIQVFRAFTSSNSNYWQSSNVTITNGAAATTVPGFGIVTLYGVAPPRIGAGITGPAQVTLSWPQAGAGFVLQSTPALGPLSSWITITNAWSISNNVAEANLTPGATAQFYRLVLP